MMRGISPPISPRRRAGLEAPQIVTTIRWDGLVPEAHRNAFAHKLQAPDGRFLVARWRDIDLFQVGGCWWIETLDGASTPKQLSRDGWGYAGPLREAPSAASKMETAE